ncbi:MAG: PLP-dependent aminotransferase family protein [Stomatobaculum sp.]|nr:PLP-dependent aminotransferase family protein [Stomatobaculum sp.]
MITYRMEERGKKKKADYLYGEIKKEILGGTIRSGEKLPSKRSLAEHLGISTVTVETAYGMLQDEGYISSRDRSGFYVNPLRLPVKPEMESGERTETPGGGKLIPPGEEQSPRRIAAQTGETVAPVEDFPYTSLLRIVREVLNDYRDRLLLRPPNAGCMELRSAIAVHLNRYRGMQVRPEQVIVGSGSEYLYGLIAQLLGGETVFGLEEQSYEKIRLVYAAHGVSLELLPMDRYGISAAGLRDTLAGVLHVTPYHSYPTGITAPAVKRYEYISWAAERGAWLVEDDFESEFSVPRKPLETLYSMDRNSSVIYLNTFTKSLAPSMRAGYMVLPERLLPRYREKLGFYSCTVPSLDQYVLAEYISRGYFEKRLNHIRRKLRQKKSLPH